MSRTQGDLVKVRANSRKRLERHGWNVHLIAGGTAASNSSIMPRPIRGSVDMFW
jgi:hypothetical protein